MTDSNDPRTGSRFMQGLGSIVLSGLREAVTKSAAAINAKNQAELADAADEPPVVAQLMIEIRSDGSRTIARGALHDLRNNESAQVHAEGRTPHDLVLSLLGSLVSLPASTLNLLRLRRDVESGSAREKKDPPS